MHYHCFLPGLLSSMKDCWHHSKIMLCSWGSWMGEMLEKYMYRVPGEKTNVQRLAEFCKYKLYGNLLEQNWPSGALSETCGSSFYPCLQQPHNVTPAHHQWRGAASAPKYSIQDGSTKH